MADDQTNPYVTMGMMGMYAPNKYISPQYKDQPLPMPGFYGTPTDAQGNPIQSYTDAQKAHDAWAAANPAPAQGTTLNSTPNAQWAFNNSLINSMQPTQRGNVDGGGRGAYQGQDIGNILSLRARNDAMYNVNGWGDTPFGKVANNPGAIKPQGNWTMQDAVNAVNALPGYGQSANAGSAGSGAAGGGANPVDMRQAYLTALSNPGKVTTPGVGPSGQSAPLGQPSVLDAFLSTHSAGPAAPASGGYSNAGFFDTLNKLRSA